jgi:hypothetical protein
VRVVAVDWSGRATGGARHLWLAEARGDELVRLECRRSREQLVAHLVSLLDDGEPVVVGLDFSFSVPVWFLDDQGLAGGPELWARARTDGERWLRECPAPFWGTPGHPNTDPREGLRATERELSVAGITPKSTFQIGGAGAVGTGSVRGWPHLATLQAAGYAIWPFDTAAHPPLVVEVWPRLCTGPVVKSDPVARVDHLAASLPHLAGRVRDLMAASEDAFDAGFTALAMAAREDEFRACVAPGHPLAAREGWVWSPLRP